MAYEIYDLTDTWYGRFIYPRLYGPVSFTAVLQQVGIRLLGSVEEPARRHPSTGAVIRSTLSGTVSLGAVDFVKTYNVYRQGYHAVQYVGTVADTGLEIHGSWSIAGSWSGTFIMIRSRALDLAASKKQTQNA